MISQNEFSENPERELTPGKSALDPTHNRSLDTCFRIIRFDGLYGAAV